MDVRTCTLGASSSYNKFVVHNVVTLASLGVLKLSGPLQYSAYDATCLNTRASLVSLYIQGRQITGKLQQGERLQKTETTGENLQAPSSLPVGLALVTEDVIVGS